MLKTCHLTPDAFLIDIETSGLHRQNDWITCIGVMYNALGQFCTKQWHLKEPEEEKALLEAFLQFCTGYQTVFTYNGRFFDLSFLKARLNHHQLSDEAFLNLKHIDIKKALEPLASSRHELETKLGFSRQIQSEGRALAKLYQTYRASGSTTYLELIKAHNQEELEGLYTLYEGYQILYGFNTYTVYQKDYLDEQVILKSQLPFRPQIQGNFCIGPYQIGWTAGTTTLTVQVPFHTQTLKRYLTPVKQYVYVLSEQKILPKSLAQFIDKNNRRPAKEEECTVYETHAFLPLAATYRIQEALWYDENKAAYILDSEAAPQLIFKQIFYLCFQTHAKSSHTSA